MGNSGTLALAEDLMLEFAGSTGILPEKPSPERYLWTDAFAVCNYLGLYEKTGNARYCDLALRLVDQVHHILGKYRPGDRRSGWISGLSGSEGERHPTRGGLRIGKALPEREAGEPFDEHLEWERDGQYFHYLTKWMHALNRVSRVSGNQQYRRWAVDLACTASTGFVASPPGGGRRRMYWKMSVDLKRPLVMSMGQHDPLDGWITFQELLPVPGNGVNNESETRLREAIGEMASLCRGISMVTDDPLGIGGLLHDALRIVQLAAVNPDRTFFGILEKVLGSALAGLEIFLDRDIFLLPADCRLAFRELGLSVGLAGIQKISGLPDDIPDLKNGKVPQQIQALTEYLPIKKTIDTFWIENTNRKSRTWTEHRRINQVMLATSLVPEGFLTR